MEAAITALLLTLKLVGSLGVFLFGMKIMSEALQKVAGSRLKHLLGRLTANKLSAVLTGLVVTCVVQSSSATTVMVVSFVSASLLSLTQAIGVIMGANIGTTLTAWMVSLLGFKVKVSAFALPAVGLGLPMTFLRGARTRQLGEVLIGFGLLFLGLELIKESIPKITSEQMAWVAPLTQHGFFSLLLFVGIGGLLTVVLQSSSATTTLTLTLAALGWLPYEMATAMVLGENIGTTVTANLAAIGAPPEARQAARVHFLFNVFGALWALLTMKVFLLPLVDAIVPGDPYLNLQALHGDEARLAAASATITVHLAAFHTAFNVINVSLMLPLTQQLERVVKWWVKDGAKREPAVRYLSLALIETPELMLVQAGKEMQHMSDVVRRMFADAMRILTHPQEKLGRLVEDTLEREDFVDRLEREIIGHLTMTSRAATSADAARQIAAMIQNAHRLERVADHCAVLVRIARRLYDTQRRFDAEDVADLQALGALVDQALENVGRYLTDEQPSAQIEELEQRIDQTRRSLRTRHIARIQASPASAEAELGFLDTITHLEEIGDRAVGIVRHAEMMRHL